MENCAYLTNEQIQRLAALSLDSLAGMQINTDDSMTAPVLVDTVDIDNPSRSRHFIIMPDGSFEETT